MTDTLRSIAPLVLADVTPAAIIGRPPRVELVRPTDLWIEEGYQRALSQASARLIREMVEHWDWRKYKAPTCAEIELNKLAVTDGQHTAIAAATLQFDHIPVLITEGGDIADRAAAFIGHNRTRLAVTGLQLHHAAVAAGDEVAVAIAECLRAADVRLVESGRRHAAWKPGDTTALSSIRRLVERKGRAGGARVLKILRRAQMVPIPAVLIEAAALLLYAPEWAVKDDGAIAQVIAEKSAEDWIAFSRRQRLAGGTTAAHGVAVALYRSISGGR